MPEEDNEECVYELLKQAISKGSTAACDYVTKNCADEEVFNFYNYRYCVLNDGFTGSLLFGLTVAGLIFCAFFLLGKIASTYLTPVLTKVSNALKLSETISGVTLLAFANGAPDVIGGFSAGGTPGGLYITIGNNFGSALFCAALVIARCIQVSTKTVQMEPQCWLRDIIYYILTSLVIVTFGLIGKITLGMVLGFFAIYLSYISVVIYQEYCSDSAKDRNTKQIELDKALIHEKMKNLIHNEDQNNSIGGENLSEPLTEDAKPRKLTLTMAEVKHIYNQEVEQKKEEEDSAEEPSSALSKVTDVITLPLQWLGTLTVPNLDEESVSKDLITLMPVPCTLAILFLAGKFDVRATFFGLHWALAALAISVPCSALCFLLKSKKNAFYAWILVPFALVASILWLKTAAGVIVDSIAYTSTAFNINRVLLGATFLALGNSSADFFANTSLSALGYGVMACTGSVSGQLFNLLIGSGLNMVNSISQSAGGFVEFDLLGFNKRDGPNQVFAIMIIFVTIFYLLYLLFYSISNKFVLDGKLASLGIGVYVVCYLVFIGMAFVVGSLNFE